MVVKTADLEDMKSLLLLCVCVLPLSAAETRVLVDGVGCRTRQLAVVKIFERIPGIEKVEVLPRETAPRFNQRYFRLHSSGAQPGLEQLVLALGPRAKHYHVLSATPTGGVANSPPPQSKHAK